MSDHVWDFSLPQVDGASWRHAQVVLTACTWRDYERLKADARDQGTRFSVHVMGLAEAFSFDRPVPGTHGATMTVSVHRPSPDMEEAIRYDGWQPGSDAYA